MTAKDYQETKRTPCTCGKGEFIFYSVQYEGWSFAHHQDVEWYEMQINCDKCIANYSSHFPSQIQNNTPFIMRINEPDTPPVIKES